MTPLAKSAIIFPGSGTDSLATAQNLLATDQPTKTLFRIASQSCHIDLTRLCQTSSYLSAVPTDIVTLLVSYRLYQQYCEKATIDYLCGLSAGQLIGAVASDMLSLTQASLLCYTKTTLEYQYANHHSETAIAICHNISQSDWLNWAHDHDLTQQLFLAAANAPKDFVIAGTANAIRLCQQSLPFAEITIIPQMAAVHTPLVSTLDDTIVAATTKLSLTASAPTVPFLSDTDIAWNTSQNFLPKFLTQNSHPSYLAACLQRLNQLDVTTFIVTDPSGRLTELIHENLPQATTITLGQV